MGTQTVKRQMSTSSRPDEDIMTASAGATMTWAQSESSQQRIVRGSSVSSLSAISDKRASTSSHTTSSSMTKSGAAVSSSTSCISQRKSSNTSTQKDNSITKTSTS